MAVGIGLVVGGLTTYGFLVLSARALGPERYAAMSALWFAAFLVGPGVFVPLEQEVSRAVADRRARLQGVWPVVKRAAIAGGLVALSLLLAALVAGPILRDKLFAGESYLVAALMLAVIGAYLGHLVRGSLAGTNRFGGYGFYLAGEGGLRVVGAALLFAASVSTVAPYGVLIGLGSLAGLGVALVATRSGRELRDEGPPAPWSELSAALGYLLVASVLSLFLVNAAPLVALVLADEHQRELVGRFIAGVILTRVPLFLFQAIQAALLPKLARLVGKGLRQEFEAAVRQLVVVLAAFGLFTVGIVFLIGPWAIRILFGEEFVIGRRDLTLLTAASAVFMVGVALAQALVAVRGHAAVALGWLGGVVVFLVMLAVGSDLLLRVEIAYLLGSLSSVALFGPLLVWRIRHQRSGLASDDPALWPLLEE